jgi:hypothetical protein
MKHSQASGPELDYSVRFVGNRIKQTDYGWIEPNNWITSVAAADSAVHDGTGLRLRSVAVDGLFDHGHRPRRRDGFSCRDDAAHYGSADRN